jgi:hypothetical protein
MFEELFRPMHLLVMDLPDPEKVGWKPQPVAMNSKT